MATYVLYTPTTLVAKALFNFDVFGIDNFKIEGPVKVSVSDSFTFAQLAASFPTISEDIYTSLSSGKTSWTAEQLDNINLTTETYASFINLAFAPVVNSSGLTPESVGNASDINISLIYRRDARFSGVSALETDLDFGYVGAQGDIVLNLNGFGSRGLGNDASLDGSTFGFHTLMHEFGHSLGLSHPHSSTTGGVTKLTADFSALTGIGFAKLGFQIKNPLDMNKEFFSIMSYDDQAQFGEINTFAQTPMILDVIALQTAYGAGGGTSGAANDVITPGGDGGVSSFRTYFDTGGSDTVNLANYAAGAYLHMGTTITGAPYQVGVSMSAADRNAVVNLGKDPGSLRWFCGEYENATGSAAADTIVGNSLNNTLDGRGGNDTIDGGGGTDTATYSGARVSYALSKTSDGFRLTDSAGAAAASAGIDSLVNVERLKFSTSAIALDVGVNQSGGRAQLLLGAVLGKDLLATKKPLIGAAIDLFDQGFTLQQLSGAIMRLDIWGALANGANGANDGNGGDGGRAGASNTQIANYLLTTVNKAVPDAALLTNAVTALTTETGAAQGNFLWRLAESAANQTQVGLVGLATTGLEFA